MTWLLGTEVVLEIGRGPRCHPGVAAWWSAARERDLFLSVATLGELRRLIDAGRRGNPLGLPAAERWLRDVVDAFESRVLDIDRRVAEFWGKLRAEHEVPPVPALLAATALAHDLVLVARDDFGFASLGVRVFDPFLADPP